MTLRALEADLRQRLAACSDPRLEARHILLALISNAATDLIVSDESEVASELVQLSQNWAEQRAQGYPLAYLSGKKGFYKFDFDVTPGVLIPRPESEHVIEVALNRGERNCAWIADLGAGSGCLGLSLLSELKLAHLLSVDISSIAVALVKQNARKLGLYDRTQIVESDVTRVTPAHPLDLIVANPPYIANDDANVQSSVHQFEPHAALYSGVDGLSAIRSWSAWSYRHLRPGGLFVCEIGSGQKPLVQEILSQVGFVAIESQKDLAGWDRVVSAFTPK